ncbi:MAG: TonB family protein [Pyrinomonadaceae bacterium]|nr:TonB family protein [Pyrinomonadaceae bacterium]
MKRCPTCQRDYEDEEMLFCLDDGKALVSFSESSYDPSATLKIPAPRSTNETPTEVLPVMMSAEPTLPSPPSPPPHPELIQTTTSERKSNKMLWILGAALILGLSAIAVAYIVTRNRGTNASQTAQQTAQPEGAASPENVIASTEAGSAGAANQTANPIVSPGAKPAGSLTSEQQTNTAPEQAATPKPTPTPKLGATSTSAPQATYEPPPPQATPTPAPPKPKTVSGGVLNGKATSLPKPAYPAAARAVRASGTVQVQVTINENGSVISASAVSGHPLLREAAVSAARSARFTPTLLSGQPVKVTGVINYNFVP